MPFDRDVPPETLESAYEAKASALGPVLYAERCGIPGSPGTMLFDRPDRHPGSYVATAFRLMEEGEVWVSNIYQPGRPVTWERAQ